MIVESLAQTGAVALLSMDKFKGKTAYFGGIKNAKFHHMVKPGDTMRLVVELTKLRDHVGSGKGIAYVNDQKVCTAELTFMIGD